MELMAQYPDKHFDLAIVDPPYGINVNVNMGRRKGDKSSDYHKFAGGDACAPDVKYFDELRRVSKNQIVWGANHFISRMPYDSPCWIAWDKGFSEDVTFATFELAWTSFGKTCKSSICTRTHKTASIPHKNRSSFTTGCLPNTLSRARRSSTRTWAAEVLPSLVITLNAT